MKKLSATIFLTVLAVGSIYGCMFDDGRRGDGARGDRMDRRSESADRPSEAQRDRTERDERRNKEKDEERKENRY